MLLCSFLGLWRLLFGILGRSSRLVLVGLRCIVCCR